MKSIITSCSMMLLLTSCRWLQTSDKVPVGSGYCIECYFLGSSPIEAYAQPRLSERDGSFYLARSKDTNQARVQQVIRLLNECDRNWEADPTKTHTYCVVTKYGKELNRIGIPEMAIDTPAVVQLYWRHQLCTCQWEVFPLIIQGFDSQYRDTIVSYMRGALLQR